MTAELRAIAHPLRLRILSLLTGAPMTAADVARELALTHANASYHLRQLHAAGVIEAAGEERIRGGLAKRYRYIVGKDRDKRTEHDPAHLPHRRALYVAAAAELRRRIDFVRHTPAGGHLTDAELWVTPELWAEVKAQVHAASDRLHRSALAPRTPGAIRVNASFVMFEMEPSEVEPTA